MELKQLDFEFPEELVATERAEKSRVMLVRGGDPCELKEGVSAVLNEFRAGDCLVINDTRVLHRRVFTGSSLEILFLKHSEDRLTWEVLCPATKWKDGTLQHLPGGITLELVARGRPQTVRASKPLTAQFFIEHGELPLPPYIQKARGERHQRAGDQENYQTAWATKDGSLAAPTASFHFTPGQLNDLKLRGVHVVTVTLHVGLGTFLPVTVDNLIDHKMHAEMVEIPAASWQAIQDTKTRGARVWALGTTVTRALESAAHDLLKVSDGGYVGETTLFIAPGFEFKIVDVLMTNFHQPRSTLLALVAAFAELHNVKKCYAWAIDHQFRLFSYGDLTVWL